MIAGQQKLLEGTVVKEIVAEGLMIHKNKKMVAIKGSAVKDTVNRKIGSWIRSSEMIRDWRPVLGFMLKCSMVLLFQ